MKPSCGSEEETCKYEDIGCDKICASLSVISGKWKLKLLYLIGYNELIRYGAPQTTSNSYYT